jgi:pyruvate dehydrogenase E1 component
MASISNNYQDLDPVETQEWLDALNSVVHQEGKERAEYLIQQLLGVLHMNVALAGRNTAYKNTISVDDEAEHPGDPELEERIIALLRWNAVAMVLRAGKHAPELGGHIASYASSAYLYEIGFNHFFHGANTEHGGDLIFTQGHSSPGIYARAFLEGRLTEQQLDNFRQEVDGKGISSYPHPWLMPEFWQFPTVSMGLGPLQAIYQARFLKYLHNRKLVDAQKRKVWAFCGDGEMDEPESLGALTIASREKLDNLIFVINCNLQRLDGPVRGNSSIIQELEGIFAGAGWNVIKVIWGSNWDPLFAQDKNGLLLKRMAECVDGDYQNYKARSGAFVREHFFGKYPELLELVKDMTDDEIRHLTRGGHDLQKVYAAYAEAIKTKDRPTVILAKTVKGYGMGEAGEAQNITHQQKKMTEEQLKIFRDRFKIPVKDQDIAKIPFYRPDSNSPEMQYLHARREALGGYLPSRRTQSTIKLTIPELDVFASILQATGEREISTTMAFVRILNILLKDKNLGKHVVPIVPDESRTFGMEGLFRQIGIYSPVGQLYEPMDKNQIMYYHEAKDGQFLEEGINEAGAFCSWMAAATSYSVSDLPMIPFYVYYSMFGFQRVGDLAWAAGDIRARGFLLGGTAGRTTLAGEGLQHQDGHNLVYAGTIPNCISYDPTFAYEMAVIIHDGMRRMYQKQESIFYYITAMNENYSHPEMPKGAEEGIIKGMYLLQKAKAKAKYTVQLLGSGAILREVIAAAELLEKDFGITANIWSATSFNELGREAQAVERENRLNPTKKQKQSYVANCLAGQKGPVIAATDYIRANADQIRGHISQHYVVLGTDGFGRSDTRQQLRHFFEVNRYYIVVAALKALADTGETDTKTVAEAIKKYKIDLNKPNPVTV